MFCSFRWRAVTYGFLGVTLLLLLVSFGLFIKLHQHESWSQKANSGFWSPGFMIGRDSMLTSTSDASQCLLIPNFVGGNPSSIRSVYQYVAVKLLRPMADRSFIIAKASTMVVYEDNKSTDMKGSLQGPSMIVVVLPRMIPSISHVLKHCAQHTIGRFEIDQLWCNATSLYRSVGSNQLEASVKIPSHMLRQDPKEIDSDGISIVAIVGLVCVRCTQQATFEDVSFVINRYPVRSSDRPRIQVQLFCPATPPILAARPALHDTHLLISKQLPMHDKQSLCTIVTQVSLDRISLLRYIPAIWHGAVTLVIHYSPEDDNEDTRWVSSYVTKQKNKFGAQYDLSGWNVRIYINKHEDAYPINLLRNMALKDAKTDFLFILDADFVPSPTLETQFTVTMAYARDKLKLLGSKTAFVVPAFEYIEGDRSTIDVHQLPTSRSELISELRAGVIEPFRQKKSPRSHAATNYPRWLNTTDPYIVQYEDMYEPYVGVMRSPFLPLFDEQFSGYGMNKILFCLELHAAGYTFVVVPDAWVIHLPHPESNAATKFLHQAETQIATRIQRYIFMQSMRAKYDISCDGAWIP